MGELYFELPDEKEDVLTLIDSVPNTWSGLEGRLRAPEELNRMSLAAPNTQVEFWGNGPSVKINGVRDRQDYHQPDLVALFVYQRLPSFVFFDSCWKIHNEDKFGMFKELLKGYLKNLYLGYITFFSDFQHDNVYENKARANIVFNAWKGLPVMQEESGAQPARIKIEWFPKDGGSEETVQPIVEACNKMKLCEYKPHGSDRMF